MPRPQSGIFPVIVAFKTSPKYWIYQDQSSLRDSTQIKKIEFEYKVAGNYMVYVSTSRQIPLCISGVKDLQTGKVTYANPEKRVEAIFNPSEGGAGSTQPLFVGSDGGSFGEIYYSTTYYGEYIRMSPKIITLTNTAFADVCANPVNWSIPKARELYNFGTYQYTYGINASSVTYGVDFRGELGGVKFSGEVALNQREEKLPTANGERDNNFRMVGTFKGERELGKNTGLSGELYYIAPDWQTNLLTLQPSKYFKETKYKSGGILPDYMSYPRPLGNGWNNIDDNDDNDPFVESDRRRYPSDLSSDAQGSFYDDGSVGNWIGLRLPSDMVMPYDDPDGVISSKDDRNRNGIRDYEEDFLAFNSDPPVFELGMDLNNNGIPDYEDDDILPDFGHSVGYVITSDGIKTQGIRGLNLNLRWTAKENLVLDFGAVAEGTADHDLSGTDDLLEAMNDEGRDPFDGKSLVGYWTTKLDVTKRSQGIMLKLGNELRAISDAVRNDAVSSVGVTAGGKYLVGYWYTIDPLNYRRALVDNIVADIVYNNIRNFEYGFKLKLGIQKRFAIADRLFDKEYSFYDPVKGRTIFAENLTSYDNRTIGDLYLVNRVSYRIGFKNEFDDWRRVFNFLNRLEIIPQYKITLIGSREFGSGLKDPRDIEGNLRADINRNGVIDTIGDNVGANLDTVTARRIAANEYRDRNKVMVQNLPILRVNYKIAENTQLQFGLQTMRLMDAITPEGNSFNVTTLGQIVSKYNYKGYNVTFLIGAQWQNYNFDINAYDPVLMSGGRWDQDNWKFYAQLFSGS